MNQQQFLPYGTRWRTAADAAATAAVLQQTEQQQQRQQQHSECIYARHIIPYSSKIPGISGPRGTTRLWIYHTAPNKKRWKISHTKKMTMLGIEPRTINRDGHRVKAIHLFYYSWPFPAWRKHTKKTTTLGIEPRSRIIEWKLSICSTINTALSQVPAWHMPVWHVSIRHVYIYTYE